MTTVDCLEMYRQVEEYARIGHHRTGTDCDAATRTWLGDQLRPSTDEIITIPYEFERYVVHEHEVTIDGERVESIPLWYSGNGSYNTNQVARDVADPNHRHTAHSNALTSPDDERGPRIIATPDPGGRLAALNRSPNTAGGEFVALVAGSWAAALGEADIHLTASVEHTVGHSASVLARLGPWSAPRPTAPIIVTTPISGWFTCAGERGTGLAVALALATELAEQRPVLFVGTTGHEIGYLVNAFKAAVEKRDLLREIEELRAELAQARASQRRPKVS